MDVMCVYIIFFLVSLVHGGCRWSFLLHPHPADPPHGLCALVERVVA